MTKDKLRLMVQGWRHIPHSYAIINQFLLLEMLRHPQLEVWHQDAPYLSPDWQPVPGLLGPEAAAVLARVGTVREGGQSPLTGAGFLDGWGLGRKFRYRTTLVF